MRDALVDRQRLRARVERRAARVAAADDAGEDGDGGRVPRHVGKGCGAHQIAVDEGARTDGVQHGTRGQAGVRERVAERAGAAGDDLLDPDAAGEQRVDEGAEAVVRVVDREPPLGGQGAAEVPVVRVQPAERDVAVGQRVDQGDDGRVVVDRHARAAHADVEVDERPHALGQRRDVLRRLHQQARPHRAVALGHHAGEAARRRGRRVREQHVGHAGQRLARELELADGRALDAPHARGEQALQRPGRLRGLDVRPPAIGSARADERRGDVGVDLGRQDRERRREQVLGLREVDLGPPEGWQRVAPRQAYRLRRTSKARRSGGHGAPSFVARSTATPPPSMTAPQHRTAVLLRSRRRASSRFAPSDKRCACPSLRAAPSSHLHYWLRCRPAVR